MYDHKSDFEQQLVNEIKEHVGRLKAKVKMYEAEIKRAEAAMREINIPDESVPLPQPPTELTVEAGRGIVKEKILRSA
jgi:hypothetical protein